MKLTSNILLTALAPLVWGSTYMVTTEMLPADMPLLASALRSLPAGILIILFCRKLPQSNWWGKLAILGSLNIGLFFYCLFATAYYLPGGLAALLMSFQPVLVIGLSALLLKSRLTISSLCAALLGIIGIALLVLNSAVEVNIQGVIYGFIGSLSMATGVVLTKLWGRPTGLSLLSFTGWQLFFGGLLLMPAALYFEGLPAQLTPQNILGYSYLCLIGAVFAYSIWFRGIEKLNPIATSFIGFLSPVSACVLGYLFLDQTFTTLQLLGALIIISAIYLSRPKPEVKAAVLASTATS